MTHLFLPTTSRAHAVHGKHLVDDEAAQRTQSSNSLGQTTYSQQYANLLHTLRTYLHMPLYSDDICRCSEARKRSTNIRDHAFCSARDSRKPASHGKTAHKAAVGGVVTHRVSWQGADVRGGSFSVVLLVQAAVADEAVRASFYPPYTPPRVCRARIDPTPSRLAATRYSAPCASAPREPTPRSPLVMLQRMRSRTPRGTKHTL